MCGIREDFNLGNDDNSTITPISIAGTYKTQSGRDIDANFQLLRDSKSNSDAGREGVRAELHGGRLPFDDKKNGVDQQAIIEFVCDKERSGLEGDEKDGTEHEDDPKDGDSEKEQTPDQKEESLQRREDSNKGKCEDSDRSLRFCGYETEHVKDKTIKTLRLEWRTKYACENAPRGEDASTSMGFFGWFFIM